MRDASPPPCAQLLPMLANDEFADFVTVTTGNDNSVDTHNPNSADNYYTLMQRQERQVASAGQSGSEEFQGLRGYVPGDSLAQVDWKGYARGRGLNVKLFEEPASGRLWLRYDRLEGVPVERRLSILCFWVQRLNRENRPFALALPGAELPPGQGEEQRLRALNLLARHGDTEAD